MQGSKEMFLENMSHEIRTSLNSVYGFAQLLCLPEGTWSEAERESYATHIRNSYNMLDMLLNDLMVSTRYDTHTYNVKQEPVDVQSVVAEAVDAMSVCMPSSVQISLTSELPEGFKMVSDGRRIRQIVQNLLTNTGQYILQGKIAVLLHKVADKIEITVIANMPAIQDKRYHAAVAKSKDDHKTGLSLRLRISRKLATLLGGNVTRDYDYAGGIKYMVQLDIKEVDDAKHQAQAKVSNVIEKD
jgi:K+-sensing histidine kinase KdpD